MPVCLGLVSDNENILWAEGALGEQAAWPSAALDPVTQGWSQGDRSPMVSWGTVGGAGASPMEAFWSEGPLGLWFPRVRTILNRSGDGDRELEVLG